MLLVFLGPADICLETLTGTHGGGGRVSVRPPGLGGLGWELPPPHGMAWEGY